MVDLAVIGACPEAIAEAAACGLTIAEIDLARVWTITPGFGIHVLGQAPISADRILAMTDWVEAPRRIPLVGDSAPAACAAPVRRRSGRLGAGAGPVGADRRGRAVCRR